MITFIKWMLAAAFTGFAWLITGYTFEYFKPYKRHNHYDFTKTKPSP